MSELRWNWVYYPYLDAPNEQEESALKAGYIKVVCKEEADKVIANNKYKRCLAMAKWCAAEHDIYKLTPRFVKVEFYRKWHARWLELAEKFKEAK